MSLRCIGNQLLQTTPSPLLAGASSASLSLWIRVNPGSKVANAGGTRLFGDAGGKLSVALAGAGNLQVGWSSNDGQTNGTSSSTMALTPGIVYHLAVTWQDGSQRSFLNGVLVHADARHGTLGLVGDARAYPFRIGSDSAGTDVTIDGPTLWVGYALTSQDVGNLRDRSVPPSAIAPASIALGWSLAGPDGVAAQVGDAGLVDGSSNHLGLSAVVGSAPTYQGGILTFDPSARIASASVAASGTSIVLLFSDSTGAPCNVQAIAPPDEIQALTLTGNPAGGQFTLSFGGQATVPIAAIPVPPPVYMTMTAPVTAGSYDLWASYIGNSNNSTHQVYEILDGPSVIGTVVKDLTFNGGYATFSETNLDSQPTQWYRLGTFAIVGTSATIRVSAPLHDSIFVDAIRIAPHGGGPAVYATNQDSSAATVPAFLWTSYAFPHAYSPKVTTSAFGYGAGMTYQADPSALQTALCPLPGIQAGGVIVSGVAPLVVQFSGPLAHSARPLLVSSDPAAVVSRVSGGGHQPTLRINGGTPIPMLNPIWGVGLPAGAGTAQRAPYAPFVAYLLPQSAPDKQYQATDAGLYARNPAWHPVYEYTAPGASWASATGYSRRLLFAQGVASASWTFQGLPAATYRASLTWPALAGLATAAGWSVTDGSGTVLASGTVDQTKGPGGDIDAGVTWHVLGSFTLAGFVGSLSVTLTNGDGTSAIVSDAARLERTSADQSTIIAPTDVVTFSAIAGWATMAGAIPAPAMVDAAVENRVGLPFVAFDATPNKTMKVGWNVEPENNQSPLLTYCNLAHRIYGTAPGVIAQDADGYPTLLNLSYTTMSVAGSLPTDGGNERQLPNLPNGDYTLMWDGTSDVILTAYPDYAAEVPAGRVITGAADNKKVFHFQSSVNYSPSIFVRFSGTAKGNGTYACDVRNLRIFPPASPGFDPSAPAKFHPSLLSKLRGSEILRFMDNMRGVQEGGVTFADLNLPQSNLSRSGFARLVVNGLVKTTGYTGTDRFFNPTRNTVIEITTAAPHGLSDGVIVAFRDFNGSSYSPGIARLSNGATYDLADFRWMVHVTSPTTFLSAIGQPDNSNITMTNTLGPGGATFSWIGGPMPVADMVDLCNQVGSDFWINIPHTANDDACTRIGQYLAAHLAPGLKVHIEWSNECWEYTGKGRYYAIYLTSYRGLGVDGDYVPGYVTRAREVQDLIAAPMAAAGRAGDVVRVMGAQFGYSAATTLRIAQYAAANGITFDELAVAPYIDNGPYYRIGSNEEPTLDPIHDLATTGQILDLHELWAEYGGWSDYCLSHRAALDASGFKAVKVVTYEGGPEFPIPYSNQYGHMSANNAKRTHAVLRHPRFFHIWLRFLQIFQDAGLSSFLAYYLDGSDGRAGIPLAAWSAYLGWDMQPGTGDPTLDAVNISDPDALDRIKSEVGGAMIAWAALRPGKTTAGPTPPYRSVAGRNGMIRSIGYPRGLFRPTG